MSEEFTCVALYGLFLMIPLLSSIRQSLNLLSKLKPKAKTTAIPLKVSMYVKKVIEIRKGGRESNRVWEWTSGVAQISTNYSMCQVN